MSIHTRLAWPLPVLLLCGPNVCFAEPPANFPLGSWYAEEQRPDEMIYSIAHYTADGRFRVEFRECVGSRSRDHEEAGSWTFSNGVLSTITDRIREKSVNLTARYSIVMNDKYTWTATTTGGDALLYFGPDSFREVLITPDSEMPGCTPNS